MKQVLGPGPMPNAEPILMNGLHSLSLRSTQPNVAGRLRHTPSHYIVIVLLITAEKSKVTGDSWVRMWTLPLPLTWPETFGQIP